jgi:hypothetical protein
MKTAKTFVLGIFRGALKVGDHIVRNGKTYLVVGFTMAGAAICQAQTDIGSTITTVSGYWTTAEGLGVGILLFVLGRKVVKKI